MFRNPFKKKKLVRYTKNLIYLNPCEQPHRFNISFSSRYKELENYIIRILDKAGIYDNDIFVRVYQEYCHNCQFYDRVPQLLYYKSVSLMVKLYPEINFTKYLRIITGIHSDITPKIPDTFKYHQDVLDNLVEAFKRVIPYMKEGHLSTEEFRILIEFDYLKDWDLFLFKEVSEVTYLRNCINLILYQASPEENKLTCLQNTLQRYFKEIAEEISVPISL